MILSKSTEGKKGKKIKIEDILREMGENETNEDHTDLHNHEGFVDDDGDAQVEFI